LVERRSRCFNCSLNSAQKSWRRSPGRVRNDSLELSLAKKLQRAAKFVFDKLNANGRTGNQFIVVFSFQSLFETNSISTKISFDFRFQFDDTTGIIKVPSAPPHIRELIVEGGDNLTSFFDRLPDS
jgi:hypothetical protein